MGLCAGYFGSNTNKAVKRVRSPFYIKSQRYYIDRHDTYTSWHTKTKEKGKCKPLLYTDVSTPDQPVLPGHANTSSFAPVPWNSNASTPKLGHLSYQKPQPNAEYSTHQVSSSTASRLIHSNVEESPHISIWYKAGHAALWCALNTIVYTVAMTGALACTTASAEPCVCASYLSFESLNGVVVKVIMICRHGLI